MAIQHKISKMMKRIKKMFLTTSMTQGNHIEFIIFHSVNMDLHLFTV